METALSPFIYCHFVPPTAEAVNDTLASGLQAVQCPHILQRSMVGLSYLTAAVAYSFFNTLGYLLTLDLTDACKSFIFTVIGIAWIIPTTIVPKWAFSCLSPELGKPSEKNNEAAPDQVLEEFNDKITEELARNLLAKLGEISSQETGPIPVKHLSIRVLRLDENDVSFNAEGNLQLYCLDVQYGDHSQQLVTTKKEADELFRSLEKNALELVQTSQTKGSIRFTRDRGTWTKIPLEENLARDLEGTVALR